MFIERPDNSQSNGEIFPFEMGYLPDIFQRKAEVELRDTPENREKGLKLIREMAKKDEHTTGLRFDDDFLLQYLKCRKYDVSSAFSKLKASAIFRKKNAESFTNFKFESLYVTLRDKVLVFLPYRCPDGCAIIHLQLNNWNPEEFPVEELKRTIILFLLQSLRDPMTQVNGFKVIVDVHSNPLRHLRYATPNHLYTLYNGTVECTPGRYKEIHIVNNSLAFKAAWLFLKHFFSEKLKKRIHFHSDSESVLKFFPRSIMPDNYGGDLVDYEMTDWLKKIIKPESIATLCGGIST